MEQLNNFPYIMPEELTVGEEYLLFTQLADGLFITLSTKGSLISNIESKRWNKAIKKINDIK